MSSFSENSLANIVTRLDELIESNHELAEQQRIANQLKLIEIVVSRDSHNGAHRPYAAPDWKLDNALNIGSIVRQVAKDLLVKDDSNEEEGPVHARW